MLSHWERKSLQNRYDLVIIGAGIVGMNAAITAKECNPDAKIVVVERGLLPNGASTKNAGFACFGSVTELLDDLDSMPEAEVVQLVTDRWSGLEMLRSRVPEREMDYVDCGGWEFFLDEDAFARAERAIVHMNVLLEPVFHTDVFSVDESAMERFGVRGAGELIHNHLEGQLDPMRMMRYLHSAARSLGVELMTGAEVVGLGDGRVGLKGGLTLQTARILVATNGFASRLLDLDVAPARAQVLITKPIEGLGLRGVFHLDRGYYYFRNVGDRILFGGGRHLDYKGEETMEMENTAVIMNELQRILRTHISPDRPLEIEHRWAGIMGVGEQRSPIIEEVEPGLWCAVRLGGMGIALGSKVGDEAARRAMA